MWMVWIAPDEEGDGRVREATGEEDGERGGSVAVRVALGGAGVGGVGGNGVGRGGVGRGTIW